MKRFFLLAAFFTATLVLLSSCKKEEVKPPSSSPSGFFFLASIEGTKVQFENDVNGFFCVNLNEDGAGNTSGIKRNGRGTAYNSTASLQSATVWVYEFGPNRIDGQDVYDLFVPASLNYGHRGNDLNGAVIEYYDASGEYRTTDIGMADQSSSEFIITERGTYNGGFNSFTVKGIFSCKLYNSGGNVLNVTDGEFYGQISPL